MIRVVEQSTSKIRQKQWNIWSRPELPLQISILFDRNSNPIPNSAVCLFFFFFFSSSGGWGKIKLKLTTLPRVFIRVVCRYNSVAFATQR